MAVIGVLWIAAVESCRAKYSSWSKGYPCRVGESRKGKMLLLVLTTTQWLLKQRAVPPSRWNRLSGETDLPAWPPAPFGGLMTTCSVREMSADRANSYLHFVLVEPNLWKYCKDGTTANSYLTSPRQFLQLCCCLNTNLSPSDETPAVTNE
jgi:hypothetical protein